MNERLTIGQCIHERPITFTKGQSLSAGLAGPRWYQRRPASWRHWIVPPSLLYPNSSLSLDYKSAFGLLFPSPSNSNCWACCLGDSAGYSDGKLFPA